MLKISCTWNHKPFARVAFYLANSPGHAFPFRKEKGEMGGGRRKFA
jgi:hypothetical protein